MDFTHKVKFSDALFVQHVDDEIVLLDMESEFYFGLDSVGSEIWKLLDDGETLQTTVGQLCEMYDVPQEQLENDLERFVNQLIDTKLASLA